MTFHALVFICFILWCAVTGGLIGNIAARRRWSIMKTLLVVTAIVIFNSALRSVIARFEAQNEPSVIKPEQERP